LCLLLLYTYLGYPLALALLTRFRRVEVKRNEAHLPSVALLISAYNEEAVIEDKLRNSLRLDYPSEHLQILVVSDGSTDRTNAIAECFADRGIELFAFTPNRGKMAALKEVLTAVSAEVVVFSDANVMYEPDAVRKLVRNFNDARVGAVSGKVILVNDTVSYGRAENRYYDIEHYIQRKEGETGAMMGADGAMYAIRRDLFLPPSADTILDDFVISMNVVEQGYWLVHEKEAVGYEKNVQEVRVEIGRKARIIAGGVQCLLRGEGIPRFSEGFQMFKFFSHKVLRWFSGLFLVMLVYLLVHLRLIGAEPGPVLTFVSYGLLGGLGAAVLGTVLPAIRKVEPLNLVHYFFMLNLASLVGCYRGFTGRQKVTWRCQGPR
jgi:cellulose synthase/poly-beta-1,6-N-acetylglucosamine synthase-like glycosyltransferase